MSLNDAAYASLSCGFRTEMSLMMRMRKIAKLHGPRGSPRGLGTEVQTRAVPSGQTSLKKIVRALCNSFAR